MISVTLSDFSPEIPTEVVQIFIQESNQDFLQEYFLEFLTGSLILFAEIFLQEILDTLLDSNKNKIFQLITSI